MTVGKDFLRALTIDEWREHCCCVLWPGNTDTTPMLSPLGVPMLVATGEDIWRLCTRIHRDWDISLRLVRRVRLEIAAEYYARVGDWIRLEKLFARSPAARGHILHLQFYGHHPSAPLVAAQDFARVISARVAAMEALKND